MIWYQLQSFAVHSYKSIYKTLIRRVSCTMFWVRLIHQTHEYWNKRQYELLAHFREAYWRSRQHQALGLFSRCQLYRGWTFYVPMMMIYSARVRKILKITLVAYEVPLAGLDTNQVGLMRWFKSIVSCLSRELNPEPGFGTFLVPAISVFGNWKRVIRFRNFGTFLKRVIRYRYFGTVFRYLRKKKLYM